MRFPVSSTAFYHYVDKLGLRDQTLPEPADAGLRQHRDRPGRQDPLRAETRRPACSCSRKWPTPGRDALEAGVAVRRYPAGDSRPRRAAPQGAVEHAGAAVGRPHLLRLRRHLRSLRQAVVPSPRGVRPGRFRHRRLGLGLPELDAGNLPRGDDQLRRSPAPGGRRRRAGAAGHLAPCAGALRALAGRHQPQLAAQRRAALRA